MDADPARPEEKKWKTNAATRHGVHWNDWILDVKSSFICVMVYKKRGMIREYVALYQKLMVIIKKIAPRLVYVENSIFFVFRSFGLSLIMMVLIATTVIVQWECVTLKTLGLTHGEKHES